MASAYDLAVQLVGEKRKLDALALELYESPDAKRARKKGAASVIKSLVQQRSGNSHKAVTAFLAEHEVEVDVTWGTWSDGPAREWVWVDVALTADAPGVFGPETPATIVWSFKCMPGVFFSHYVRLIALAADAKRGPNQYYDSRVLAVHWLGKHGDAPGNFSTALNATPGSSLALFLDALAFPSFYLLGEKAPACNFVTKWAHVHPSTPGWDVAESVQKFIQLPEIKDTEDKQEGPRRKCSSCGDSWLAPGVLAFSEMPPEGWNVDADSDLRGPVCYQCADEHLCEVDSGHPAMQHIKRYPLHLGASLPCDWCGQRKCDLHFGENGDVCNACVAAKRRDERFEAEHEADNEIPDGSSSKEDAEDDDDPDARSESEAEEATDESDHEPDDDDGILTIPAAVIGHTE